MAVTIAVSQIFATKLMASWLGLPTSPGQGKGLQNPDHGPVPFTCQITATPSRHSSALFLFRKLLLYKWDEYLAGREQELPHPALVSPKEPGEKVRGFSRGKCQGKN